MRRKLFFLLLFFGITLLNSLYAQVKIGNNPQKIHKNSILELESTDKVLVISRLSNAQMTAITPERGALVYNTDEQCVFMHNGINWRSLCGGSKTGISSTTSSTPPTVKNTGDFWINTSKNNETNIWDGSSWITISNNPIRGNGAPSITTAPNPKQGDIYVNQKTGSIYAYDGTTWVVSGANAKANNGVLVNANNTVQLGGAIVKPTIIDTNGNAFGVKGLQDGDTTKDDLVTVNRKTGEFKKVKASNLLTEEVIKRTAKFDDQIEFEQVDLKTKDKVNVYRNGVRIDFKIKGNLGDAKIILEPEAKCYAGDEIRIVQFY